MHSVCWYIEMVVIHRVMLSYLAASSICFVLSILPFFPPSLSPYYSPSLLLALFYFRLSLPLSPLFTISSSRPLLFPSFPPYLPIIPPLFFSFPFHFCFILPLLFPPSSLYNDYLPLLCPLLSGTSHWCFHHSFNRANLRNDLRRRWRASHI